MITFVGLKHENLNSGSGCMKAQDYVANFGGRNNTFPIVDPGVGNAF